MKRKFFYAVLAFVLLYSATACTSMTNTQPKADKVSSAEQPLSFTSTSSGTSAIQDTTVLEAPGGNVDYSAYEPYGLLYDSQNGYYTFNGSIVRYFNDPVAGAGFTNYFTGTVDLEAEYNGENVLIGIKECSQEAYDYHTQKQAAFSSGDRTDVTIQNGTQPSNTH